MKSDKIATDSLGFPLVVTIIVNHCTVSGRHKTYEDIDGNVSASAVHQIEISDELSDNYLNEVIAHEVYHLFQSVRHLITADEEVEATVFGQLVSRIHKLFIS